MCLGVARVLVVLVAVLGKESVRDKLCSVLNITTKHDYQGYSRNTKVGKKSRICYFRKTRFVPLNPNKSKATQTELKSIIIHL